MDCLVQHLTVQINEGNTSINCPVACIEPMQQHEIKKFVSNELFERFDRQRFPFVLEINPFIRIYYKYRMRNSCKDFNLTGRLEQFQILYIVRSVTQLLRMAILSQLMYCVVSATITFALTAEKLGTGVIVAHSMM